MAVAGTRAELPALLEAVFPGRCLLCGRWLMFEGSRGLPLCGSCRDGLSPLSGARCTVCSMPLAGEGHVCTRCRTAGFAFGRNFSVFPYAGAARRLITAWKFAARRRLSRYFAAMLAGALQEQYPGLPLVPVPPRPGRRGRDPVERLARLLEASRGVQVVRCLVRTGGVEQKSLDFAGRAENLKGRILVQPAGLAAGLPRRVVLFDDVFTTGATADACARALRGAGCAAVDVLTLALD